MVTGGAKLFDAVETFCLGKSRTIGIDSSQSLVDISFIDVTDTDELFLIDLGDFAVIDFKTAPIPAFIDLFSSLFTNSTDSYTS